MMGYGYKGRGYASSYLRKMRRAVIIEGAAVGIIAAFIVVQTGFLKKGVQESGKIENNTISVEVSADATGETKDYIKWVDFSVSYEALCKAYDWDVDTHDSEHAINWIELLAYTAAKTGGNFDK